MTNDEDPPLSAPERATRRRGQVAIGVAGAVAVLSGVGFLATQLMNESQPTRPEPAALAPQTTPASPTVGAAGISPSDARTPGKATKQAAPAHRSPAHTPASSRQASPAPDAARASSVISDLRKRFGFGGPEIADRTEKLGEGTVRIVTAQSDLTGDRELILAGDDGTEVGGGVHCTTDVPNDTVMSPAPEMLMCWRTSPERSVITMTTTPEGEPSTADSVVVIQREWDRLD
ncbi:hypothetical protein FHR83_000244 [Actinoplanes campanulatus]|uniref:Uncharacterized protein n=1 Tax=Actinoplanes campanulatus TaxID=113559 RepID=A0A7W5AAU0_9ACTN|nr:hypothetical protein [Actinoplanes campanulatus]MBB3092610.1 hypothetical protein [Actinoplanes campanulatus]GGM97710.1 hypothetical protein GCM10010109_01700 [Actinoplanes campanulatus]GID34295.1 hypothetical protein Aca09nite_08010 [Actinoplanes campanulatus]